MRWGLLAGLAVTANALVIALPGCDPSTNDAAPRYYIPPDASDDNPSGSPNPITVGGLGGDAAGDATGDGPLGGDAGLTLALAGWWRAPFAAAPWAGTPSTGASGTASLTAGAAAPAAGAALNGLAPADFNGTSAYLVGPQISTLHSVSAFSGWALVEIDAINTNSTDWGQNKNIVCTGSTEELGVFLRDDGVSTVTVGLATTGPSPHVVSTAILKNVWQLVQWRSNGVTMSIRVNGGAWASTDTAAVISLAYSLEVGRNPSANQFFDGRIADLGMTTTTLTDADFDGVRAYAAARYGGTY